MPEQPGAGEGAGYPDVNVELSVCLAEHFGSVNIPQKRSGWMETSSGISLNPEKLTDMSSQWDCSEERDLLRRQAERDSFSSAVLVYLDLTRAVTAEPFGMLGGDRGWQANLAWILGATR